MCVYTYVGAQGGQKKVLQGEAIVSCMMQALRSVPFKSSTGSWLLLHLSSPINYFLSSTEHHFYQLFFFLKLSCRVGKGLTMGFLTLKLCPAFEAGSTHKGYTDKTE